MITLVEWIVAASVTVRELPDTIHENKADNIIPGSHSEAEMDDEDQAAWPDVWVV